MSTPVDEFPEYPSEKKAGNTHDGHNAHEHGHDGHDDHDDHHIHEHGQDAISPLESDYPAPSFNDQDSRRDRARGNEDQRLKVNTDLDQDTRDMMAMRSPSAAREQSLRLEDDLALLEAERVASASTREEGTDEGNKSTLSRTRSRRSENVDEFDEATNPLHEKAAVYNPPEDPNTKLSVFIKRLHDSSFIVRYVTYIVPVVLLLLVPLLVGALAFPNANVGGVELLWFSVWLEIVWLTLWAGRIVSKLLPIPIGVLASIFTNNAKKWRDCAKQLEIHATIFFWWLGVEISFLPTMKNHHTDHDSRTRSWESTLNRIIISFFVWTVLNLIEKFIIQLIAISFHTRTYADRIEINKFQIGSLTKLYGFSRERITNTDADFEDKSAQPQEDSTGFRTPKRYAGRAQRVAKGALNKVGDVAGAVAADFTGRKATNSTHPHTVVLTLLRSTSGCQLLARRLYRTFARDGFDTVFSGDLKEAFDNNEEADAAFAMFDRDMNGDISMEELEAACVEIGRERKSITASLKDLDSVVSRLDNVLEFFVIVVSLIVFLTLISTSTAGVLTSAGSSVLALSWLFSATAQEFLQSVIFVFVKHPFDVGDRVTVYGNAGDSGLGDDYFVKSISLLYTEFKKMQGHIVQAPNSYLNSLFILNQRRSGALAEAVPITIRYGTTLEQIDGLRQRLVEFVRSERREFQANVLTELREVSDNFSITMNVVFFYKSNWQNEGLRLQRRNKFICMLMIALQEIGIEGSRMNLQGAHVDFPVHVNYHGLPLPSQPPPSYDNNNNNNNNNNRPSSISSGNAGPSSLNPPGSSSSNNPPPSAGGGGTGATRHPSILRKGMNTAAARARGDSVASRKHVDFSLGMSGIAAGDIMGDVFEDRGPARVDVDQLRETNRENSERRIQEIQEEEEERRSRSSSRRTSQQGKNSMSNTNLSVPGSNNGDGRRSTESHNSSLHNRFFRRRSRSNVSASNINEDLEQGQTSAHRTASPDTRQ